jgi:hypothetical protein
MRCMLWSTLRALGLGVQRGIGETAIALLLDQLHVLAQPSYSDAFGQFVPSF